MNTSKNIEISDEYEIAQLTTELTGLAKQHKALDNKLSKESPNMFMQDIRAMKTKIAEIRRVMNNRIRKLEKFGIIWENEIARISIGMVA